MINNQSCLSLTLFFGSNISKYYFKNFKIINNLLFFQKKDQPAAEGEKTEGEEGADKPESADKETPAEGSEDKPEGKKESYLKIEW